MTKSKVLGFFICAPFSLPLIIYFALYVVPPVALCEGRHCLAVLCTLSYLCTVATSPLHPLCAALVVAAPLFAAC